MDDGWIFPYPMCGDGVTEKAQATSCWNSWGKRDTCAPGKSGAHKGKARCIRKATATTEKLRAGFQEKLLAQHTSARTENGHTWARRES